MTVIVPEFENGEYYIQNKTTQYYMDTYQGSTSVSANIQQGCFDGDNPQIWVVTLQTNGYYTIVSKNSNLCASVSNGSSSTGASIVQSPYGGSASQLWKVDELNSGAYKITSKAGESAGLVLACANSLSQAGVDIQQKIYVSDTDYTDEWLLKKVIVAPLVEVEGQQMTRWCWATSARMFVKKYYPNITLTQPDAVTAVHGELINYGGEPEDALAAMEYYISNIPGAELDLKLYRQQVYSEAIIKQFLDDGHVMYVSRGNYVAGVFVTGHAIIISGYVIEDGTTYFIINDPLEQSVEQDGPLNDNNGKRVLMDYDTLYVENANSPVVTAWQAVIVCNTSYDENTVPYYFGS